MRDQPDRWKRATLDTWTAVPSGSSEGSGEPGSIHYLEALIAASNDYAPWLPDAIGLPGARGKRLLDVGCGPGVQLARFARAGASVTGLDLVPVHVEQARAHLASIEAAGEVLVGDAEMLPFPDRSFDLAVSANALQFTPDIRAAVREMGRVVRPGGEVRLVLYHRGSMYYRWQVQLVRGILRGELLRRRSMSAVLGHALPWAQQEAPPFVRVFSRRSLRRLMDDGGLNDVSVLVRGFSPSHFPPATRLSPPWQERLGRLAGWYICGRGVRA
jgi:SAM-dependent methyltransferase